MEKFEKDITDNGAMMLCEGIIRQAVVDYRHAVLQLWKCEHDIAEAVRCIRTSEKWYRRKIDNSEIETRRQIMIERYKDTAKEVERFFNSEFFELISDGMEGKECFEKVKAMVEDEVREVAEKKKVRRNISMVNVEKK